MDEADVTDAHIHTIIETRTLRMEQRKEKNAINSQQAFFYGIIMAICNGAFPIAFYFNKSSDENKKYDFNTPSVLFVISLCTTFVSCFSWLFTAPTTETDEEEDTRGICSSPREAFQGLKCDRTTTMLVFSRLLYAFEQLLKVLGYAYLTIVEPNIALSYVGVMIVASFDYYNNSDNFTNGMMLSPILLVISIVGYIAYLLENEENKHDFYVGMGYVLGSAVAACAGDIIGAIALKEIQNRSDEEELEWDDQKKTICCSTIDCFARFFALIPGTYLANEDPSFAMMFNPVFGWTWKTSLIVMVAVIYMISSILLLDMSSSFKIFYNLVGQFLGLSASYVLFGGFRIVTFAFTLVLLITAATYKTQKEKMVEDMRNESMMHHDSFKEEVRESIFQTEFTSS